MAIASPIVTPPTTPTTQDLQVRAKLKVTRVVDAANLQLYRSYNVAMDTVWRNPDGLTPQQVLDAFGTDAAELFTFAATARNTVNTATPGTIGDDPDAAKYTISFPTDANSQPLGTVTVTAITPPST